MITIAELVSLGKLGTLASGESRWVLGVAVYVEQSTDELHPEQCINPLWHPVLSSLTRSHVETGQQIHFYSVAVSESPQVANTVVSNISRQVQKKHTLCGCVSKAKAKRDSKLDRSQVWRAGGGGGRIHPMCTTHHCGFSSSPTFPRSANTI